MQGDKHLQASVLTFCGCQRAISLFCFGVTLKQIIWWGLSNWFWLWIPLTLSAIFLSGIDRWSSATLAKGRHHFSSMPMKKHRYELRLLNLIFNFKSRFTRLGNSRETARLSLNAREGQDIPTLSLKRGNLKGNSNIFYKFSSWVLLHTWGGGDIIWRFVSREEAEYNLIHCLQWCQLVAELHCG